jgi:hypothetical protein
VTWVQLVNELQSALVSERGANGNDGGRPVPVTYPYEPFVVLAQLHDTMVRAIKVANANSGWALSPTGDRSVGVRTAAGITIEEWLMRAKPRGDDASVRYYAPPNVLAQVEVAWTVGLDGVWAVNGSSVIIDPDIRPQREEVRVLVGAWNAAIKQAGELLVRMLTHPGRLTDAETAAWWGRLRSLAVRLDVSREYPRPGFWDRVKGALREAGTKSVAAAEDIVGVGSKVAGQAAAELAKTAGIAAGSFTEGFFDQAGLTAYVVVGIAIAVALS